jgi:signal peptidase I
MTSIDETIGTQRVLGVERARRSSAGWVVLEWLRSFGAAAAQVLLTIAVLLGLLATAPVAFGQISTTVMSDSMEPGLHAGDVVILRPVRSDLVRRGQVVLVDDPDFPGRLRLHRLVDVRHGRLVLKGDANVTPDSSLVGANKLHGVGWLRVPWIGLPVLWLRDQTYLPLGLAALALMLLAWLAASDRRDDDAGGRDEAATARRNAARRLLQRSTRLLGRLRRSKTAHAAGASLLMAGLFVAAPLTQPGSAAAFNGTTSSPSNSIATGTFDCPARPISAAATVLYYSYMPASGSPEPDVSGSAPAQPGTLSTGATRVSGNCSGNQSPSVSVDGTANGFVASNNQLTPTPEFTVSLWFKTAANTGVLASFGTTKTAAPTGAGDRQIYFKSNQLSFAMERPGNPMAWCSIATIPTTNQWHLAVATFVQNGSQMTLWLDNASTSCTTNDNNISLSPGYWRFGGDTPLDPSASNTFAGQLDETAAYTGPVSGAQVTTIAGAGH